MGTADLLIKRAILAHWTPGQRNDVIPGVLALTFVQNVHGAMGLFGDHPALLIFLALSVIAVLAILLRDVLRYSPLAQIGFGAIVGGALGNVIDRFAHHYVVDYVALRGFYVFNLADACITLGLALLAYSLRRKPAT